MKIGRISLNVPAIADISEQDFYALVKGSIDIDKKVAWEQFSIHARPFRKVKSKPETRAIEDPKE